MLYLEDKIAKIVDIVSTIMPKDGCLGVYDDDPDFIYGDLDGEIYNALRRLDPLVEVNHGMSKIVIVSSIIDYVIKIPLTGIWVPVWDEEEEEYNDDQTYFEPFSYGGGYDNDDYCAVEVDICDETEEENPEYSFIFPKTFFYKEINKVKYYLQEKCKCGGYDPNGSISVEIERTGRNLYEDKNKEYGTVQSLEWCISLVENYGVEKSKEIMKYLKEMNITDLHNGNIGYNKYGKPILLDFCGFDS